MKIQSYWVYILYCKNDTYYTGYTINMQKRYQSHINGTGKCKYTRSFKPLHIAQCWKIQGDKSLAMQIERHIKTLSRVEKEKILKEPLPYQLINDNLYKQVVGLYAAPRTRYI